MRSRAIADVTNPAAVFQSAGLSLKALGRQAHLYMPSMLPRAQIAALLARLLSMRVSLYHTLIDEVCMPVVSVSAKFQVVIPRDICEALRLEPGQRVQVLQYQNRIEFIPVQAMRKMRGYLTGIATTVTREKDRV